MSGWRKTASASRRSADMRAMNRAERRAVSRPSGIDRPPPSPASGTPLREILGKPFRRRRAGRHSARGLTSSAAVLRADRGSTIAKKQWQDEAWGQYRAQGELWYAVEWLANAVSRVRLKAARIVDGGDEPEIVEDGPVAEIMEALAGGIGGQSSMLKSFTVKLMVPGDSYLVGYEDAQRIPHWGVYSVDVIRKEMSGGFSLRTDENTWLPLPAESLVVRIWNQDEQFPWQAISPTMPALGVLREIDLYNRKIITQLTSRLASNGMLLVPNEAQFAVREEFSDAADPFVAEIVDIASKAIQNPGSAAAALPIPIRLKGELIETIRHITFADNVVQETLDGRDKALARLATMLNVPEEVLTGMGGANHWSASQIEAQAIKINIAPVVETICKGLTEGYLLPALHALEDGSFTNYDPDALEEIEYDGERYVVWYDASELKEKPDLGERAVQLHDRVVISDDALRRATGFDEGDAPTEEERNTQILTRLSYNGQQAVNSYELLTGTPVPAPPGGSPAPPGGNLPPPGAGTGTPDQGERSTSRGPSNGAPPQTSGDNPPVENTLEIPTRVDFTDGYDLVLTPRNGSR